MGDEASDTLKNLQKALTEFSTKNASPVRDWLDIALKTLIAAFAALGTYYLSAQKQTVDALHTQQVQSNDDVKLIVDLVDGNPARRSIGLAIAKAYAGSRIPPEVYEAVNIYVTSISSRSQNQENNVIAGQIPAGETVKLAGQAPSGSLPARIYIQYQRAEDLDAITAIRQGLNGAMVKDKSIVAPPVEHVRSAISQPILKCFKKTECDDLAQALVDKMKEVGAPTNLTWQYIPGYEKSTAIRQNHFEAWLGPLLPRQPKPE